MATQIAAQEQTGSISASVKIIRKYHSKLRKELNVPLLLPYLNKHHLITAKVHDELTQQTITHASKVDKLVAELPMRGVDFLERFIKCLRESVEEEPGNSHEEIAEILEKELQTPGIASNNCSNAIIETAMEDDEVNQSPWRFETGNTSMSERVLKGCHFRLRNELNVPSLLPYLNKYHLITAEFHDELTLQATHAAKVDRLVAELPRIGGNFLERFIECLRESVEEEPATSHGPIADALEEELKFQKTHGCVYSREINVASTYEGTSQIVPLLVHAGQTDEIDEESVPTRNIHHKRLYCYCITTLLVIVMIMLVAVLITLSQVPHVSSSVNPHYVCGNSTAELFFDNVPWLGQIALAMDTCEGQLYQIQDQDCHTLPKLNTSYVDPNDRVNNLFMLPGSVIHFTVDPSASGQIWILSGLESDIVYVNHPTSFDCHHPPPGAYCFEAEDHPGQYPYYVTQPDYYYLQFRPEDLQGVRWDFNRTIFDIKKIADKYPSITTLTRDYYTIFFSFPYKKSCILLYIPPLTCECDKMMAANAVRQDDNLIFAAIPIVICALILVVVVGVCIYCHFRKSF